jgi:cell division protein ZapA
MPATIRVHILDREYALRVNSEDDARMTRRIAAYVDQRLRAFRSEHPDRPELTGAIITALAITEELFEVQRTIENERGEMSREVAELDGMLSRALEA